MIFDAKLDPDGVYRVPEEDVRSTSQFWATLTEAFTSEMMNELFRSSPIMQAMKHASSQQTPRTYSWKADWKSSAPGTCSEGAEET
jgi:hypothetical protein